MSACLILQWQALEKHLEKVECFAGGAGLTRANFAMSFPLEGLALLKNGQTGPLVTHQNAGPPQKLIRIKNAQISLKARSNSDKKVVFRPQHESKISDNGSGPQVRPGWVRIRNFACDWVIENAVFC